MYRITCAVGVALALMLPHAASADINAVGNWNKDPLVERQLEVQDDVPDLPAHTIIRPADLSEINFRMPVLLWENGGCVWDNRAYRTFLERISSTGIIVLAKGKQGVTMPPRPQPGTDPYWVFVEEMKMMQRQALDWLMLENNRPGSPYHRKIDPTRIAAMGFSCGGFIALENAAVDHRINSVLIFNSSIRLPFTDEEVEALLGNIPAGTPVGIFNGGPTDVAYPGSLNRYGQIPEHIPAILGNWYGAGHAGFWQGPQAATYYQPRLAEFAIHWIDYTLVSGREESRAAILDDPCLLCDDPNVIIERKHWDAFVGPKGPPRAPHH